MGSRQTLEAGSGKLEEAKLARNGLLARPAAPGVGYDIDGGNGLG